MQSSQGSTGTNTQNNVVPAYLQNASQQAVNQGESIATSSYSPYTGQAIAGQTGNQDMASALAGNQAAAYNAPGGLGSQATQAFNSQNVGAFVNPNTSGVVNTLGQRIQQQYNPAEVALQSGEASTGNLGSNRASLNTAALQTQKQNALSDMASSEYGNAVNAGTQAFEAERGDAAQQGQTINNALNTTGAASRATEQNQLNYNYNQFLTQRDWQANHLQPLLSALGASRNDVEQTGTNEGIESQSSLGSMIGSGAALGGALASAEPNVANYLEGYTQAPSGSGANQLNYLSSSGDIMGGDEGGGALDTEAAGDIESGALG
jgi:hypothetical protein